MIQRQLQDKLLELYRYYPVVSLNGPRQSGKTTLIRQTFQALPYVTLEDPDIRLQAETDPRGFLSNYPEGAIFDEVQRVPALFSYIQGIVDADKKIKFILSGSQNFLLNEKISQSLAGRVGLLTLLPLSSGEIKATGDFPSDMYELMFNGFYPALFDRKIPPGAYYPSYLQTYIERDVRLLKNIENESLFLRFLKLCAGRAGQLLNISSLANDAGIAVNTAKSWISLLETSYVLFTLNPYFQNFNKRVIKSPKLYFYDTGLLCHLLGIEESRQLKTFYAQGNIFENYVIIELLKQRLNKGKAPNLYFWRDKSGLEIDCLFERPDGFTLVEIKAGKTQLPEYFSNLAGWPGNASENFVVYGGDEDRTMSAGRLISWKNVDSIEN